MAMLISKFHRLIQSRLLWGAILVVIIFSFVIWGTTMPSKSDRDASSAGTLYGEPVSQQTFRSAYFQTYMATVLSVGKPFDITEEIDRDLNQAAWRRIVSLEKARELGLVTTDAEVLTAIQTHPGFAPEGQFSKPHYDHFVQNVLGGMGFSAAQFEEHVRQEIAMQKLHQMLQQSVLVTPYEINRTFRSLSDTFKIQYVALKTEDVADEVSVSEDEARAFFDADPGAFRLPEKVRVNYIVYPIEDFVAAAEAEVTEDDALAYYSDNMEEFTVTNETETASIEDDDNDEAAEDIVPTAPVTTTLEFDEVKEDIIAQLVRLTARNKAADAATDFVSTLLSDREGNATPFDAAAVAAGKEIFQTPAFSVRESVEGIDAGLNFNSAAFSLNKRPDEYFSDAVIGASNVYVLALDERLPSRIPEYDEVAEKVREAALASATEEALSKKAQQVREAAVKAVEEGGSFKDALAAFDLTPVETETFSIADGLEEDADYSQVLMRGIISRNAGEITDLLPSEDAIVLAYVAERAPGDPSSMEALRPQIRNSIKNQRARILFEEWQDYLLREAGFVENRPSYDEDEEEELGDEEEDELAES